MTMGTLTEQTGIFPAVFGQTPDPMQKERPKGDLGPKYTITWTVPTSRKRRIGFGRTSIRTRTRR